MQSTYKRQDNTPIAAWRRLTSVLREAVKGSNQDFTQGSISRSIFLLAVPMILEMCMESLFGVVDVFFVARLGADAVAVVGITESLLTLVFAVALGLSMATTAIVARRTGEKKPEEAALATAQSIGIAVAVSLPIGLVAIACSKPIFRLMGASPAVETTGATYAAIVLGSNTTVMLLFVINAAFRGAGDAAVAMRALWVANIINMILDPCLIFGPGPFPAMGVTGAAVATSIGRGVGVGYQLYVLVWGRSRIRITRRQLAIHYESMSHILRVSVGGMFQYFIATASWLGLIRIVAVFGDAALAGYTIAIRIIVFAILPSWGLSNAAATMVGQNLGAGNPSRAEQSVWLTAVSNMLFLGCVTVLFVLGAEPLIGMFTSEPDVISAGVSCLRYVSYGYVFYAYGMVMVQAFNGAGDTLTPTIINLCCYWLFQIPLSYWLATRARLGANGVFIAIAVSESALATVGLLIFRRGAWKRRLV
ncbi:MAG TPA: MATE family efflux transporter [Blastocatellia bacterium]|nr:MATE family efflux transporter [Blastocatellia bacterium]